ncbi:MAG: hypothetical protein ACPGEG_05270 [Salibacteraceae bacterium]
MIRLKSILVVLSLFCWFSTEAQSTYGYLGKRFYLAGDISAGPSIIGKNEKGNRTFAINVTGTASLNLVLTKKNVLSFNYKRYSDITEVKNRDNIGIELFPTDDYYDKDIGSYKFKTNEVGFDYKFFFKNLDAPLGSYISLGMGVGISHLEKSIFYNGEYEVDYYYTTPYTSFYSSTNAIYSPIIRLGIGQQTVFGNRFFYNYGIDIGLNLAGIYTVGRPLIEEFVGSGINYDYDDDHVTDNELEIFAKSSVQTRLFMNQLINFRMGIGMLLF